MKNLCSTNKRIIFALILNVSSLNGSKETKTKQRVPPLCGRGNKRKEELWQQ